MDEYSKGVFECLSWLEDRMRDLDGAEGRWDVLKVEIESVIFDLRRGVSVDFRNRLKARF